MEQEDPDENDLTSFSRRRILQTSVAAGVGGASITSVAASDGVNSGSPPERVTRSSTVETNADGDATVLLLKNCDPWGEPGNELALDALGYEYDIVTSGDFNEYLSDLSSYETVIIASTQNQDYYDSITSYSAEIESFVDQGGTLVGHVLPNGWDCNGVWSDLVLPGDLEIELSNSNDLEVLENNHNIVDGIDSADLDNWGASTHGNFTNVDSNWITILIGRTENPAGEPTYVEYPHGNGRVLATLQTIEWPYSDEGSGTTDLLKNELEYAIDSEPEGGEEIDISVSRQETAVKSPVTVQVEAPVENGFEYYWQVADTPSGSSPGLLHGENATEDLGGMNEVPNTPEMKRHATLRPDLPGDYTLEVDVIDEVEGPVGRGDVTISVNEKQLEDYFGYPIEEFETASELAEAYAPVYKFHTDEMYFPTRYEAYVENAEVQVETPDGTEVVLDRPSLIELGDGDVDESYDPTDESNRLHLIGSENDFTSYQSQYPRAIYASVTDTEVGTDDETNIDPGEYVALTYWAFYLFDRKSDDSLFDDPGGALKQFVSAHASDTETVTILFDETGPQWIGAAQHFSGEYLRWEKLMEQTTESPFAVYPALDAHSSYLVETNEYNGTIPGQFRFTFDNLKSTYTGPLRFFDDVTGSDIVWEFDKTGETENETYQLVMLSDDEEWTEFAGGFTSDEGWDLLEGGLLAQQRENRWNDPAQWIPNRMLPEPDVLDADLLSAQVPHFTVDGVIGAPSAFKIRYFTNPGRKPHTFVIDAKIDPSESPETIEQEFELPLGWNISMMRGERDTIEVPLDNVDLPSEGTVTVSVAVKTYSAEVASEEDTVYTVSRETPLSITSTVELNPLGDQLDTAEESPVSPGESVTTTMEMKNTGSESNTFLTELSAEGPDGDRYEQPQESMTTVTLDPDESAEVTPSWVIPDSVPEGTFDLSTIVWLESDAEERKVQLAKETEPEAFSVEKPSGTLEITTEPEAAKVIIVDAEINEPAPASIEVPIGSYDVEAYKQGYEIRTTELSVNDGETTSVTLELEELGEKPSVSDYTSEDGIVHTSGLHNAIDDWRADNIEEELLQDVMNAWQSGESVTE